MLFLQKNKTYVILPTDPSIEKFWNQIKHQNDISYHILIDYLATLKKCWRFETRLFWKKPGNFWPLNDPGIKLKPIPFCLSIGHPKTFSKKWVVYFCKWKWILRNQVLNEKKPFFFLQFIWTRQTYQSVNASLGSVDWGSL